jgi:FkbM family methyltransferase
MHSLRRFVYRTIPCWFRPQTVTLDFGRYAFRIARPWNSSAGLGLLLNGVADYEPETMRLFGQLVRKSSSLVDIGANIGVFTAVAKCVNPTIKVWAFEPEPKIYSLLAETIRANAWNHVTAEQMALSDSDGTADLFISGELEASLNPEFRPGAIKHTCPVRKLDTYCADHAISEIDLIKIDTESTEPQVFSGGLGILKKCRPDIICEVLAGRTERKLEALLQPLGYRYFHITGEGLVSREEISGDREYKNLNYFFTARKDFDPGHIRADSTVS